MCHLVNGTSALCVALAALLVPPLAFGQQQPDAAALVERAIAAYDDLAVEEALELLERAERNGELTTEQSARLHFYRGLCLASLDEGDALESFRQALLLDPDFTPPTDLSPRVVEWLTELREEMAATQPPDPEPVEVAVPEPDPEPTPTVAVRQGPPPPPRIPYLATWIFGVGAAAALVSGCTALGLLMANRGSAQDEAHLRLEAQAMADDDRLTWRVSASLLSLTVALGVATFAAWLAGRQHRRANERRDLARAAAAAP
jgi:tetratricopeptide (TPR) repeat protein